MLFPTLPNVAVNACRKIVAEWRGFRGRAADSTRPNCGKLALASNGAL